MLEKFYNCTADMNLIEEIKKGDKNAFKELYKKYYTSLVNFAWYRTYSIDTARDLVQDVFCKIWICRNKLDSKKSIKSYLYKSVSNAIINNHKLRSTSNLTLEYAPNENAENEIDNELIVDMRNAVSNLPEKLKIVFTLSRYDGFNYKEIAEICEISVKAVEKRMSNAFRRLRKIFPKNYF
jgi:RNA polymerase sigma-70 factor (ECF subfamily)